MLRAKQLQAYLYAVKSYTGQIDGDFGRKSQVAMDATLVHYAFTNDRLAEIDVGGWSLQRKMLALTQIIFERLGFYDHKIDGLDGPNTSYANELYQNYMRGGAPLAELNAPLNTTSTKFPRYRNMTSYYGPVGQNIELYDLPYAMRLAWDTDEVVHRISLHQKCAQSALGCLEAARDYYGMEGIKEGHLDMFGESLNVRKMRGGDAWSVHSWAAAIDLDPSRNQFRWGGDQATLAGPLFETWWEIWEEAGWVSLGRERNYDWMHVQACRL